MMLNKVVTDYGASNEVAVQTGFLFDFYPVLKVLLEPSIRLGRPNVEPLLFRTGANEVVWEFSDIKCGAHVLATGRIEDAIPLILLCYKKGAPQKGQPESCRRRARAMVCRSVAMDQGLCRSTRTGRTPSTELGGHFGDG